jgi:hypothetical protein
MSPPELLAVELLDAGRGVRNLAEPFLFVEPEPTVYTARFESGDQPRKPFVAAAAADSAAVPVTCVGWPMTTRPA